jgi:elongation factor Ts
MEINAKLVKELRDQTGAGMMDCKKALIESEGDLEKATAWLREKGIAKAISKSDRDTKEGRIYSYIHADDKVGVLIEINCETDFVARTDKFEELCRNIAMHVAHADPMDTKTLLEQKYVNDSSKTIQDVINEAIATIGENIQVTRFIKKDRETNKGKIYSYIHTNNKIGVLVELNCETEGVACSKHFESLCKDIAMHIAASNPLAIRAEDLDHKLIEKEREIYRNKALNEGKPLAVIDKIVDGQVKKLFKECCLLEQAFVKDETKTVYDIINEAKKEMGENIVVSRFTRYLLGE